MFFNSVGASVLRMFYKFKLNAFIQIGVALVNLAVVVTVLVVGCVGWFGIRSWKVEAADAIEWRVHSPGNKSLGSRFLCGPDSLFLVALLDGRSKTDYPELIRYVRPGMQGASLAQLMVAAECLGYEPEVSDSSDWQQPPSPCIVHINDDHFVVLVTDEDGRTCTCDPVKGVRSADWSELQRRVRSVLTLKP